MRKSAAFVTSPGGFDVLRRTYDRMVAIASASIDFQSGAGCPDAAAGSNTHASTDNAAALRKAEEGFRVRGSGFRVPVLGSGFWFTVQGSGSGFRVRVQGSGFRVQVQPGC
jgi:hypothetical protein